jgi:hypothetical protein
MDMLRFLITALLSLLLLLGNDAIARPLQLANVLSTLKAKLSPAGSELRVRASLLRGSLQVHRELTRANTPLTMPKSNVLTDEVAASKTYAASWTCRESSRLLIDKLGRQNLKLQLDSSGKNAFLWGNEGWVSYHYYAVDNPKHPTVLVDPTASSNFARDARPGGLLYNFLIESSRDLKRGKAGERVAARVARGGLDGLLLLADAGEIAVYREALERAARLRAQLTRTAEQRK